MDKIAHIRRRVYASAAGLSSEPSRRLWWYVHNGAHWQCSSDYGCARRVFFAHQIVFIVRGWGEGEYRGERFRAGPGSAFVMDLAEEHGYRADAGDPWEMFWVRFDGPGVHEVCEALLRAGRSCVVPVADPQRMRRDFEAIFKLLNELPPGHEAWVWQHLTALAANLAEGLRRAGLAADPDLAHAPSGIAAALERLRSRHGHGIALAELARTANMSPFHFLRRFKQATGFTPMEYLEKFRIGRAQELMLSQPELRLKEIAARVGFEDPAYFSRVFRKRTGLSPRAYRRNLGAP